MKSTTVEFLRVATIFVLAISFVICFYLFGTKGAFWFLLIVASLVITWLIIKICRNLHKKFIENAPTWHILGIQSNDWVVLKPEIYTPVLVNVTWGWEGPLSGTSYLCDTLVLRFSRVDLAGRQYLLERKCLGIAICGKDAVFDYSYNLSIDGVDVGDDYYWYVRSLFCGVCRLRGCND